MGSAVQDLTKNVEELLYVRSLRLALRDSTHIRIALFVVLKSDYKNTKLPVTSYIITCSSTCHTDSPIIITGYNYRIYIGYLVLYSQYFYNVTITSTTWYVIIRGCL